MIGGSERVSRAKISAEGVRVKTVAKVEIMFDLRVSRCEIYKGFATCVTLFRAA